MPDFFEDGPSLLGTHVLHHVSSESGDLLDERVSFFPLSPHTSLGIHCKQPLAKAAQSG